jgi:hypothetical protein
LLLILIAILLFFRKELPDNPASWSKYTVLGSLGLSLILAITAIRNLPFIDFRAFKVGVNIGEAMQPSAPLEYAYVMKRGEELVILDQYPTDDGYEFVEMNLKNPEALPKITDFAVWNDEGEFTEEILTGKKILILVSNLSKMSVANMPEITSLVNEATAAGLEVKLICASSEEETQGLIERQDWNIGYYLGDATVVKTIIRSNPGIVVLNEGTVVGKYHHNNTPTLEEVVALWE